MGTSKKYSPFLRPETKRQPTLVFASESVQSRGTETEMWKSGCWSSLVTFAGMVLAVMAQASTMVVTKFAMSDGSNKFVLVFYCNSLSALLLLPSLLLLRRYRFCFLFSIASSTETITRNSYPVSSVLWLHRCRPDCPPLTSSLILRFFLLSMIG